MHAPDRMRQRLALVTIEENDIAGLGLGLAQLKPEPNALDLSRDLPPLQRVPWPPPPEEVPAFIFKCITLHRPPK